METVNKKVVLESAIKAIKDQINAFDTFEESNSQLTVLIRNLTSTVDKVNPKDDRSIFYSDNLNLVVPPLYSIDDVGDKRIQNLQSVLNAVEVLICVFSTFSCSNQQLSSLCNCIHGILERIRAVRTIEVNVNNTLRLLIINKEKAESLVEVAEVVSKIVSEDIPIQLFSDSDEVNNPGPSSKQNFNQTNFVKAGDKALIRHNDSDNATFSMKATSKVQALEINALHLPDFTEASVVFRSSEKCESGDDKKIPRATGLVDKIRSDEMSSDVRNLLRQIEQICTDPNKVKELSNTLKKGDFIKEDSNPNIRIDSPEIFEEFKRPNSKETPKFFELQSKPRADKTNESRKMSRSKSVNRTCRRDLESVTSAKESTSAEIFMKMTRAVSESEILTYFKRMGSEALDVQIHLDRRPSRNFAGYAFVAFESAKTVKELLKTPTRFIRGVMVRISKVKGLDEKKSYQSSRPRLQLVSNAIVAQITKSSYDSSSSRSRSGGHRSRSHRHRSRSHKSPVRGSSNARSERGMKKSSK